MKKAILFFSIIIFQLLNSTITLGQKTVIENKAIDIVETRTIYINGGFKASTGNGKSRVVVPIQLPRNTVEWYYSFSTSSNPKGTKNLNLAIQLGAMLLDPTGITSSVTSKLKVPAGSAVIDAYLLDFQGMQGFENKVDLNGGNYSYYPQATTQNTKQGVIRVTGFNKGTYYLGLKNPSTMDGVNVSIEVTAVVRSEKYIDEWTTESKEIMMTSCKNNFNTDKSGQLEVCVCCIDKVLAKYKPSEIKLLNEENLENISDNIKEQCFTETGNLELKNAEEEYIKKEAKLKAAKEQKSNEIERLLNEAKAYTQANEYAKSNDKYLEALELNETEPKVLFNYDKVYNSLGWNFLLLKEFEKGKEYITKALSYNQNSPLIWRNLAHFHLLKSNFYEAEKLYTKYKRKEKMPNGEKWDSMIADNLLKFESLGLGNDTFGKVRELLKIKN